MVEKLALFQYKMDTLTASRGADQDFDLSPPERVKMEQEHVDRTLDSTYNRLRPEVAKVRDTIHHPTIQNGDCVQGVKPTTEASSPATTETDRPDKLNLLRK